MVGFVPEADFEYGARLIKYNQYVGWSLNVNGQIQRDTTMGVEACNS